MTNHDQEDHDMNDQTTDPAGRCPTSPTNGAGAGDQWPTHRAKARRKRAAHRRHARERQHARAAARRSKTTQPTR